MSDAMRRHLQAALDELDSARDASVLARARAKDARDAVHESLDRIAAERSSEGGIDADLARSLYWLHPEVHVERIGAACGLHRNEVHRFAGETFTVTGYCYDCGTPTTLTLTSRTAVAKAVGSSHGGWALCDSCAEKRETRRQQMIQELMADDV